ncbi:MAG: DUF4833 domain-containing protein [Bacteroidia bacterium]|nr:MAG: DUF4833 domain-containing protein [Bacteroidia bacterium]
MNQFRYFGILMILIFTGSLGYSCPGEPDPDLTNTLFVIERSRDSDYLVYMLNRDSKGIIDENTPIEVYWVKNTPNNTLEPLTRIQNRYGYGIQLINKMVFSDSEWYFQIVAFPDRSFVLKQDNEKNYRVYLHGSKGEIAVEKLFVNFSNNSFWNPEVSDITLFGRESRSGAIYHEIITSEK